MLWFSNILSKFREKCLGYGTGSPFPDFNESPAFVFVPTKMTVEDVLDTLLGPGEVTEEGIGKHRIPAHPVSKLSRILIVGRVCRLRSSRGVAGLSPLLPLTTIEPCLFT